MRFNLIAIALFFGAATSWAGAPCEYEHPEMLRMFNTKVKAGMKPEDAIRLLESPDLESREGAVQLIAQQNYQAGIPALMKATEDKCPSVRGLSAWTLGKFNARQSIPRLIALLKDSEPNVRGQAAFGLGMLKSTESVDSLIARLKDSDSQVRMKAAYALGQIRDNKAAPFLVPLLRDTQAGGSAMDALGSLCAPELIPKVESVMKDQLNFSYVQELLTKMKASCKAKSIVDDLNSKDGLVAQAAQVEINKRRDPELIPPLIEVLKTGTIGGRAGAALCLAWVKTPKAVDALIGNLTHEEDVVVRTAAYALGEIGDAKAVPALKKVRNHPDKTTRANIETAIQKLGN